MGGCFSAIERGAAVLSHLKDAVSAPPPTAADGGAARPIGWLPPRAADGTRQIIHGCTVTRVTDGDTVVVDRTDGLEVTVRLRGVDAPERAMPGGLAAKQAASGFCLHRQVAIAVSDVDRYGRMVGDVVLARGYTAGGERSLGLYLLREGCAWHYAAYDKRPEMAGAMAEAVAARRGLWAKPGAEPPWEYRKRVRAGQ